MCVASAPNPTFSTMLKHGVAQSPPSDMIVIHQCLSQPWVTVSADAAASAKWRRPARVTR